jgi:hypothetical protein
MSLEAALRSDPASGGAPLPADGVSTWLSDVDPPSDVDLHKVELERRVVGDGLDHSADAAPVAALVRA